MRRRVDRTQGQDPSNLPLQRDSAFGRRLNDEQPFLADRHADGEAAALLSPKATASLASMIVGSRAALSSLITMTCGGAMRPGSMARRRASTTIGSGGRQRCRRPDEGRPGLRGRTPKSVMIDATYLKAHRTATGLRLKTGGPTTKGARSNQGRHEHQTACRD